MTVLTGARNPRDAPPLPKGAPRAAPLPEEKAEVLGEESYRRTKVGLRVYDSCPIIQHTTLILV